MKRSILFAVSSLAFVVTVSTYIAHAADAKDFPIKVHVSSSEVKPIYPGVNQCITVLIDGKKYELVHIGSTESHPIHPGDHQARVVKDEAKGSGQFYREYEILFADGKTEEYRVFGESE
jgi:hypothetical protein